MDIWIRPANRITLRNYNMNIFVYDNGDYKGMVPFVYMTPHLVYSKKSRAVLLMTL